MSLDKWNKLLGNFDNLKQSIIQDKTANCYIFETTDEASCNPFAVDFAKALLCDEAKGSGCDDCLYCKKIENNNYEDIYYINRESGEIKVSEIRTFLNNMNRKSLAKNKNIGVIFDADYLNRFAQNALLKELEEPNNDNLIVLFVSNRENLLQTVRSRAVFFRLNSYKKEEDNTVREAAKGLLESAFANKPFYQWNEELSECLGVGSVEDSGNIVTSLLNAMLEEIKSILLKKHNNRKDIDRLLRASEYIEETRKELEYNTRVEFAMRKLLFRIGEKNE